MGHGAKSRRGRWRSRLLKSGLALVALLIAGGVLLDARFSVPQHSGPATDHFDGQRFRNARRLPEHGLGEFLRWRRQREGGAWDGYSPERVEAAVPERVHGDDLRVTFVGHASVLIQTAGMNLLTDPIWSERASPVGWAGPRRHVPPGIEFEALPPIDAVLISHNHYDHLDLPTLRRLASAHAPVILLPSGNAALLEREGIPGARDLDWWEVAELRPGVRATCVPAQHFSGRGLSDRMAALWGGFVIETPGGALYFAGDTGAGPHFAEVRERFGSPRLALLPIGAYLPSWFMRPVHVDPREAVEAHLVLGAHSTLAIHFGCFELADDAPEQPLLDLDAARVTLGVEATAFRALRVGESWDVGARAALVEPGSGD